MGLVGDHRQVGGVARGVVVALVGVDTAQGQAGRVEHVSGQIDGLVRFDHAGAALAHVDLDAQIQWIGAAKGLAQQLDLVGMIHADGQPDPLRQRSQPPQLGRSNHLVGDEDVVDAAIGEDLGLTGLGATDALCASLDLALGHCEHAVGLDVRPQPGASVLGDLRRARDVGVQDVQVQHQRRRVQILDRPANRRRRVACRKRACAYHWVPPGCFP